MWSRKSLCIISDRSLCKLLASTEYTVLHCVTSVDSINKFKFEFEFEFERLKCCQVI
jgi:hypothetical protein